LISSSKKPSEGAFSHPKYEHQQHVSKVNVADFNDRDGVLGKRNRQKNTAHSLIERRLNQPASKSHLDVLLLQ
jgi:hypothetical protein